MKGVVFVYEHSVACVSFFFIRCHSYYSYAVCFCVATIIEGSVYFFGTPADRHQQMAG